MLRYLLFLLFPCGLGAQNVAFSALCNARSVVAGVPFEVNFRLDNDKIKSFTPPDFKNFDQLAGPSTMQSVSYVNGVSTSFETRSYTLAAQKEGEYTIGAAKVQTATGKNLSSAPLKITVSKGDNGGGNDSELGSKVLLRIEVSNPNPVVGEQVVVDLKIYSQIGIEQIELMKEPEVSSMFSHYVRSFDESTNLEVLNGQQYKSKLLRRLVVFPSKSGELELEPAIGQIGVMQSGGNGLFGVFQRLQNFTIRSNAASINVRELDGSPSNFMGAVGKYEMQAYLEKGTITSDDVIQVNLRIIGEGDIKQVLPPNLNLSADEFEIYPPNIKEDVREGNGVLGGVKEIEYVITPKVVGNAVIRPEFVFFDHKERQFVKLDTALNVQILQGNKKLPTIQENNANKTNAAADTTQQKPKVMGEPQTESNLGTPSGRWLGSVLFWLLVVTPAAATAGWAVWYQKEKARKALITEEMLRQRFAGREAHKRLSAAQQAMQSRNTSAFYAAVSAALLGYVSDKLQIPNTLLTADYLHQKWAELGLPETFVSQWQWVMHACDMAMFAAAADDSAMNNVYQKATDLINTLETVKS